MFYGRFLTAIATPQFHMLRFMCYALQRNVGKQQPLPQNEPAENFWNNEKI